MDEDSRCYRLAAEAIQAGHFEGDLAPEQYGPFTRGSSRASRSSAALSNRSAASVRQPSVAAAYLSRTATMTTEKSQPRSSISRASTFGSKLASSLFSTRTSVLPATGEDETIGPLPQAVCPGEFIQENFGDFDSLISILSTGPLPAVMDCSSGGKDDSSRKVLSHKRLSAFLAQDFPAMLQACKVEYGATIAVVLPNGPEMGVCVLGCLACAICAPLNAKLTAEELSSEIRDLGAKVAIVMAESAQAEAFAQTELPVLEMHPDESVCGLFSLSVHGQTPPTELPDADVQHRERDDKVLLLQTSGTSGKKKTVSYTLDTLAVGAVCVIASWGLSSSDVCFNMMPLFHVGGIVRNLLSPILAGGSTVLAPVFDAALFTQNAARLGVTWYYAAPTMHQLIVAEALRGETAGDGCLRLIGNAAGPLLPSLASSLKSTFRGAVVLPSYGMTECMPISSPPLTYQLDRAGTSGKGVGPNLAIVSPSGEELRRGKIGCIAVQGPPNFKRYENVPASQNDRLPGGWFDTGDLGWMDKDGYLYITGRSKDVINRGGEIISPAEVEDAVGSHPSVKEAMAFPVHHDILQEVVGVAVVTPEGHARVSLTELKKHVAQSLHDSKWPQALVYLDRIPLTATNKIQRVGMAQRLGLPEMTDGMPAQACLFEATCPPGPSQPQQKIPCSLVPIKIACSDAAAALERHPLVSEAAITTLHSRVLGFVTLKSPQPPAAEQGVRSAALQAHLKASMIPGYAMPGMIIEVDKMKCSQDGSLDPKWLKARAPSDEGYIAPRNHDEGRVQRVIAAFLGLPPGEVSVSKEFKLLGLASTQTPQVAARLRQEFKIETLEVQGLTSCKNIIEVVKYIKAAPGSLAVLAGCWKPESQGKPCSPTAPAALLTQAMPLVIAWPLKRLLTWYFFAYILHTLRVGTASDGLATEEMQVVAGCALLVLALIITVLVRTIASPLLGLAAKWLIMGRARPGNYSLWGQYYLRRMLAYQLLQLGGRGIFEWHPVLLSLYYRLGGAKIGKGVKIHLKAQISDFDLISIADNVAIDAALVRPFRMAPGTMMLQPIHIEAEARICMKAAVAPGATVGAGKVVGPLSCTLEAPFDGEKGATFAASCRPLLPAPDFYTQAFLGWPLIVACKIFAAIPPLLVLAGLLTTLHGELGPSTLSGTLRWFANPDRYGWYILIRVARVGFGPFFNLAAVILVKRFVIGKFKAGKRDMSQLGLLRHWLMGKLMPGGDLRKVAPLLGRNLELVSWVYRALGAKIGKRIWWPGSGLDFVEYDLLTIEDDVVFGSRSVVQCADTGEMQPVHIEAGSMVADRCVLLPGTRIGRGAVIGSGTLIPKGSTVENESVWLGSVNGKPALWQAGSSDAEKEDTVTPYGRAMHQRKASYWVWPVWVHALLSWTLTVFKAVFWTCPLLAVLYITFHGFDRLASPGQISDATALGCIAGSGVVVYTFAAAVAMAIVILSKRIIIGRRLEGSYNWDDSSYNQRWLLHRSLQTITKAPILRDIIASLGGSIYLVWYFRLLGAEIGRGVCLYPNGADPPMTEPDLVVIDDGACVDDASLVCHINSRGEFKLNKLAVGNNAVMCSHSRLLSGSVMDQNSVLLEHTLVVGGDIVPKDATFQGWPSRMVKQATLPLEHFPVDDEHRIAFAKVA